MNIANIVSEAERLATAGEDDGLGFGGNNAAGLNLIDAIYGYVGKHRAGGEVVRKGREGI